MGAGAEGAAVERAFEMASERRMRSASLAPMPIEVRSPLIHLSLTRNRRARGPLLPCPRARYLDLPADSWLSVPLFGFSASPSPVRAPGERASS